MVQLDQLRGFHLCLHAVHHLAFGQEFLRLLQASRLCNDSQQHKIEIRKRSFIRHLRIYSKACVTTYGPAWTSKHHFTSFHTPTACTRAPTSMVPTQHVHTLRSQRALVRSGQSTQHCAPYHPMRTHKPEHGKPITAPQRQELRCSKKPIDHERTRRLTTSCYLPFQHLSFAAQKRLISVYSQKATPWGSVGWRASGIVKEGQQIITE